MRQPLSLQMSSPPPQNLPSSENGNENNINFAELRKEIQQLQHIHAQELQILQAKVESLVSVTLLSTTQNQIVGHSWQCCSEH